MTWKFRPLAPSCISMAFCCRRHLTMPVCQCAPGQLRPMLRSSRLHSSLFLLSDLLLFHLGTAACMRQQRTFVTFARTIWCPRLQPCATFLRNLISVGVRVKLLSVAIQKTLIAVRWISVRSSFLSPRERFC